MLNPRFLPPFTWSKPYGLADNQHCAEWHGMILWVDQFGNWSVCRPPVAENKPYRVMIDSKMQAPGTNLQDAQRRAQAAAMGLYIS